jgi:protein-tyrosine-phosphatase
MKKILFICLGNTCRSPMAVGLFEALAGENGVTGVSAGSAGLSAWPGDPASQNAVEAAREAGADISGHRARLLTQELFEEYDEIYAMTPSIYDFLKENFPDDTDKIFLLGDGIPDPWGGDLQEYRTCRDKISAALGELLCRFKEEI